MGNCCPKASEEQVVLTQGRKNTKAFQGQGHRLGTGDEANYRDDTGSSKKADDDLPPAAIDPNLSPEERARIREERAAATEARLKKMGVKQPKKKKTPSDAPLVGPNSKPTMQWTL
eukprot:scaffold4097_cov166-Amphora_coffeaeformis.AAC.27